MSNHNLHEALQAFSPVLDHIITKSVCENLARQRRDGNPRRLSLKNVAEIFEVGISPAHAAMTELEGGDVGFAEDLVVRVHVAAHAMGAGILHLRGIRSYFSAMRR